MMFFFKCLGTIQELVQVYLTISISIGHSKELNKLVLVLQHGLVVHLEEMLSTFDLLLGESTILVGVNHVKDLSIGISSAETQSLGFLESNGSQSKIFKWIANNDFLLKSRFISLLNERGTFTIFTATGSHFYQGS